jgi:hypothetical protein
MTSKPRRRAIIYPGTRVEGEANVRDLFNLLSNPIDLDARIFSSLNHLPSSDLIELIEEHDFMALVQAPLPQMVEPDYENADQVKWQVGDLDDLLERTWMRNQMEQDWFKHHIHNLSAKIVNLKDLLHPQLKQVLGTEKYSIILFGSFIWKPQAEDMDMIVIAHGRNTPGILRLGNAYIKIPGLHELFPWLSGNLIHLNCTNDYLFNSPDVAEPIWNMRNQASGAGLSIVGSPPSLMPAYTLLMQPLIVLGRQARTAMIFPGEPANEKIRYRIEEARKMLVHIVSRLPISLDELNYKWLLNETNMTPQDTYWSVIERDGVMVGAIADAIDKRCKEYLVKRVSLITDRGNKAACG